MFAVTSPVVIKGDSKFFSMDEDSHGNFRHGSLTNDMDLSQTTWMFFFFQTGFF